MSRTRRARAAGTPPASSTERPYPRSSSDTIPASSADRATSLRAVPSGRSAEPEGLRQGLHLALHHVDGQAQGGGDGAVGGGPHARFLRGRVRAAELAQDLVLLLGEGGGGVELARQQRERGGVGGRVAVGELRAAEPDVSPSVRRRRPISRTSLT